MMNLLINGCIISIAFISGYLVRNPPTSKIARQLIKEHCKTLKNRKQWEIEADEEIQKDFLVKRTMERQIDYFEEKIKKIKSEYKAPDTKSYDKRLHQRIINDMKELNTTKQLTFTKEEEKRLAKINREVEQFDAGNHKRRPETFSVLDD